MPFTASKCILDAGTEYTLF